MTQYYDAFERFGPALSSPTADNALLLGSEDGYSLHYVPFEHVNTNARLVLVGITPGPTQMKCARARARELLNSPTMTSTDTLREIKKSCAFSGMRERINEMLDHFGVPQYLGVETASSFWGSDFGHFNPTSVVPNAAFKITALKKDAYFNGPFSEVLRVALLRREFEDVFIPSIESIRKDALYIGMGPVVDEALNWCASRGVLAKPQILGCFPHASGASGSQFAYFMRRKRLTDLKPNDPVRGRAHKLDAAYERIAANVKAFMRSELNPHS